MEEKAPRKKLSEQFSQVRDAIKRLVVLLPVQLTAQEVLLAAVDKNGDGKISKDDFGLGDENIYKDITNLRP